MVLLEPAWLLLAIPLRATFFFWRMPSRLLMWLRVAVLVLVVGAMCRPALRWPSRAGTVAVVVDRSYSMPAGSLARQQEAVELLEDSMPAGDMLTVVSFGQKWAVEKSPFEGHFGGFLGSVDGDGSMLSEAVEASLALIGRDSPGRVLVLSDGRWTGKNPSSVAVQAAGRKVAVDYRVVQRGVANDTAIAQVEAPQNVTPGEAFMVTAWVESPVGQEISYELTSGGETVAAGSVAVGAGRSRLTFRDRLERPGVRSYTLRIAGEGQDPTPENNVARLLVGVKGPRPILVVSPGEGSGLAGLLERGGLEVAATRADGFGWGLEELAGYSAVVLENVAAGKLGETGMENLAAWVEHSGGGLMVTGGKNSYGPGGYYKSALERVLPVSMELRREHRKLSLAVVVALDRSGSMAAPVGAGRTKMDLANIASVQVLDLLAPTDELGVVAVDSSAHVIAQCEPIGDGGRLRQKILQIDSMGGGIFVYTALEQAARMVSQATAGTKHIILFADAADAEEPGQYLELLAQLRQAGVTVSVIGLGTAGDVDAAFLEDVARRGEGRVFFTENAEELPRLFAQDTFVVARSTFIEEPTAVKLTGGMAGLSGRRFGEPAMLGGYNLCYMQEGANLAAVSVDEYGAPVVANWRAGLGRVVCYTGEADGEFTGAIATWDEVGEFMSSLARWAAGESSLAGEEVLVTHRLERGISRVQVHLDPEREAEPFRALPKVLTLKGVAGARPEVQENGMRWVDADTLELEVALAGRETALSTVDIEGLGATTLSPVCLPYSPEFAPVAAGEGEEALKGLARATGGRERIELTKIWEELPKKVQVVEIGHFLAMATVVVLLVEVMERRTGMISGRRLPVRAGKAERARGPKVSNRRQKPARVKAAAKGVERPVEGAGEREEPAETEGGMLEAMRRAQHQAKGRRG